MFVETNPSHCPTERIDVVTTNLRRQNVSTHDLRLCPTPDTRTTIRCVHTVPDSDANYTKMNPNGGSDPIRIRLMTPNQVNTTSTTPNYPRLRGRYLLWLNVNRGPYSFYTFTPKGVKRPGFPKESEWEFKTLRVIS